MAGFMGEGNFTVNNCHATNVNITAIREAGDLVGYATGDPEYNTVVFTDCRLDNSEGYNIEVPGSFF